jgi:hypothetical protein
MSLGAMDWSESEKAQTWASYESPETLNLIESQAQLEPARASDTTGLKTQAKALSPIAPPCNYVYS